MPFALFPDALRLYKENEKRPPGWAGRPTVGGMDSAKGEIGRTNGWMKELREPAGGREGPDSERA